MFRLAVVALAGMLLASAPPATAQQLLIHADSTQVQLGTALRAFYFSLAHQDWEALSAQILPAKVVAHHPAPEALVMAARLTLHAVPAARPRGSAPAASDPSGCSSNATAVVEQAIITLDGDWAEVSVPRCDATTGEADEFRFIRFEGRWWIVYIELFRT